MDLLLIDLTIVDVAEKILGDSDDSFTNQKSQNKYRTFCAPPKQGPGSGGPKSAASEDHSYGSLSTGCWERIGGGAQSQLQAKTTPSGVYPQAAEIG